MRGIHFDNKNKELKKSIIIKTLIIFFSGVVCAWYCNKTIDAFIEKDIIATCLFALIVIIWGYVAAIKIEGLIKHTEQSIDFLRDLFKVDEKYRKADIELLENRVRELQDELGKFKNTEV